MVFPNYLKSNKPAELLQADFEKALNELSVNHVFHNLQAGCIKGEIIFEIIVNDHSATINYIDGNESEYKDLLVDLSTDMQVSFEYNDDEPPPLEDMPLPPPQIREHSVAFQPIRAEDKMPDNASKDEAYDDDWAKDLPRPTPLQGAFDCSHMFDEDEDEDETIGVIERCGMEYYLQSCVPIKNMGLYLNNPDYVNAQLKYLSNLPSYAKRWPHIYGNNTTESSGGW